MAPESIRSDDVDARADVDALGAVAHFLLTDALRDRLRTCKAAGTRTDEEARAAWANAGPEP